MSWRELLDKGSERVLPWYGSRKVHDAQRTWTISGRVPREHGWYRFLVTGGREATWIDDELQAVNISWADLQPRLRGYLVGDRFIPDGARVDPDPAKLIEQTVEVYCVELGLERFARAIVAQDREGYLVYLEQQFPEGPDAAATRAYQDRAPNLNNIPGVTPALDLAFRWMTYQRDLQEARQKELQRLREEEDKKQAEANRMAKAMRDAGTAVGRRALAGKDFETAAREALRISGAELLDVRDSYNRGEKVVQYLFRQRRLECVVDRNTLQIIDAGVCLTDHRTGKKGDKFFTLESLPGVIGEAMDLGKLVVWRHIDGDDYEENYDDD